MELHGSSEEWIRALTSGLLAAVPADRSWRAELGTSIHPLGSDPQRFYRDMHVHTYVPGMDEPSFVTLNRQHWSDDPVEMVEAAAEHALLNLTRLELQTESGLDDATEGAERLARAAASGDSPWTTVLIAVRGRPGDVDALRMGTPLSTLYVVPLDDRIVAVVHRDPPLGTTLECLAPIGRDVTIPVHD